MNNKLNNKIFVIYLGGKHPRANIEVHDLVITSGQTIQDTFEYCRNNWFVNNDNLITKIKPHVDGYFQVKLPKDYISEGEYSLFCINYGGYLPGQLAEMHEFVMVFAIDKVDAIKRSNKLLKLKFKMLHMDNCLEVDDVIDISKATNLHFLSQDNPNVEITMHSDYYSI